VVHGSAAEHQQQTGDHEGPIPGTAVDG